MKEAMHHGNALTLLHASLHHLIATNQQEGGRKRYPFCLQSERGGRVQDHDSGIILYSLRSSEDGTHSRFTILFLLVTFSPTFPIADVRIALVSTLTSTSLNHWFDTSHFWCRGGRLAVAQVGQL